MSFRVSNFSHSFDCSGEFMYGLMGNRKFKMFSRRTTSKAACFATNVVRLCSKRIENRWFSFSFNGPSGSKYKFPSEIRTISPLIFRPADWSDPSFLTGMNGVISSLDSRLSLNALSMLSSAARSCQMRCSRNYTMCVMYATQLRGGYVPYPHYHKSDTNSSEMTPIWDIVSSQSQLYLDLHVIPSTFSGYLNIVLA